MRNILIITTGRTPQIVTETLFCLLTRKTQFVPDEIHLVTTRTAAPEFEPLQSPQGMLAALYDHCGVKARFVPPVIIAVEDSQGIAVADVRTEHEAIAFGNCVTRLIATKSRLTDVKLHVSLAGGRKTMGWYAGAALSLFGRPEDELSHVLLEPDDLEMCPDFWWPTVHDHPVAHKFLKDATGKPQIFNARDAKLDLALIPFVRLSPFLATEPFSGEPDYARVVEELDRALRDLAPARLRVDVENRSIRVGDQEIELPHRSFALYALLAEARKKRWPASSTSQFKDDEHYGWMTMQDLCDAQSRHLQRYCELLSACHRGAVESSDELIDGIREEIAMDVIGFAASMRTTKARISGGKKGIFRLAIRSPRILQQVVIAQGNAPGGVRPFGLALDPRQIEFIGIK